MTPEQLYESLDEDTRAELINEEVKTMSPETAGRAALQAMGLR